MIRSTPSSSSLSGVVGLRHSTLAPALVTLLVLALALGAVIWQADGNPLALARLGNLYSESAVEETEGYDGQFVYYIARDLRPQAVVTHLDVPAYRYQRILLPVLAHLLSFGSRAALPWVLPLILMLAHTLGVWGLATLLAGWQVSPWYSLAYGLFAGFLLALRLDLPEPLAYALVVGALLANRRGKIGLSWALYALALFAKEVTAVFLLAQLLADGLQGCWRRVLGLSLTALVPYSLFQLWLWAVFGQPGIGSGGAMATPFEMIPYMGLWRIGGYSLLYLLAMLVVFGPSVLLPSLWGVWNAWQKWRTGNGNVIVLALLLNAGLIAFIPFSTFRETGGLLRFTCGLVLAVCLYAARYRLERPLNYSLLWPVLNVFLLK